MRSVAEFEQLFFIAVGLRHLTDIQIKHSTPKNNKIMGHPQYLVVILLILFVNIIGMLSPAIKIGNVHHINALESILVEAVGMSPQRPKPLQIPFYNLVCKVIQILNEYARSSVEATFNIFLVDHYTRKYANSYQDLYRHFFGFTHAWKKFLPHHEEPKLLLSFLSEPRNNRHTIKQFLKLRKCFLKTLDAKILQELPITHQDALTICHTQIDPRFRPFIVRKLNELFISLKRRLINTAKINGAVLCEFFMTCMEDPSFHHSQPEPINEVSEYEEQSEGEKLKGGDKYHVENLSFSEDYANYYQSRESKQSMHSVGVEEEWEARMTDVNQARTSLQYFKGKDHEIDQRVKNTQMKKKSCKQLPEGWQHFIETNQIMKQKLLNQKF